jgi:DNA-binding NarL/FixJ family response regulator
LKPNESAWAPGSAPIVVVVSHPILKQRADLHTIFSARHGFVLLQPLQTALVHQVPSGYLQTIILAEASQLTSEAPHGARGATDSQRKVLILGPEENNAQIADYILAGAMGFLPETSSPSVLRKAVKAVADGEYWASRKQLTSFVKRLVEILPVSKLTPRELEIVGMLAAQNNNRTIAANLGITYDTVRWHLRSIYAKLGVKDRREVGAHAGNLQQRPELPAAPHLPDRALLH